MTATDFWLGAALVLVLGNFVAWMIFLYRHGHLKGVLSELQKDVIAPTGTIIASGGLRLEDKIKAEVAKGISHWTTGAGAGPLKPQDPGGTGT